jgi:BirA family biotin operon repressor/biotin-[acetyl-CoA-carboxylase] ligase
MRNLDAEFIRSSLDEPALRRLERFEVFTTIESTNSYLMRGEAPGAGNFHVAVTDNQTAGRGRHGRTWRSPPGSGLCLSVAYTFAAQPRNLPALTLAVGMGLIDALEKLGIGGVTLKWPNDLVAGDGKLGGILTESRALADESIHVVTGVGLNIALPDEFDLGTHADWAQAVSDLASLSPELPPASAIAARLIDGLCGVFVDYEAHGFAHYAGRWPGRDWLRGRELTIDRPRHPVRGVAAGVADDGALLVEVGDGSVLRVTSGTILLANTSGAKS